MKRIFLNSFFVGIGLTFLQIGSCLAQPGTLDNTFTPPAVGGQVYATAIQADGKILIGGGFEDLIAPGSQGLARLNTDGTLDTSFEPEISGFVECIRVQSDGKILVGGTDFSNSVKVISRLNIDGSLDSTFDLDPTLSAATSTSSFDILPNGKIAVHLRINSVHYIHRLNADGSKDNTFIQIESGGFTGGIRCVKALPNGKILVGGGFTAIHTFAYTRLVLLNTNGAPDNDFTAASMIQDGQVLNVDVQDDGKIVFGGTFTTINGSTRNRVARLTVDGFLDGGTVDAIFGTGFNNVPQDIQVMPSGKILFVGAFTEYNGATANRIIMVNSDGTIDSNYDFGAGPAGDGNSVSIQPDGKIILGGNLLTYDGVNLPGDYVARINGECFVNPAVSVSGITLTSSQAGATYQWIDCDNGNAPILGETGQSFTPTANGNYAVAVSLSDCDETSECVAINSVSLDNFDATRMLVFPNPTSGIVNIQNISEGTNLTITDISGRVVYSSTASNDLLTISTQNWSNGIYLIQIELHGAMQQEKMVVSK